MFFSVFLQGLHFCAQITESNAFSKFEMLFITAFTEVF